MQRLIPGWKEEAQFVLMEGVGPKAKVEFLEIYIEISVFETGWIYKGLCP